MTAAVRKTNATSGLESVEYGTWGYSGPRWWMDGDHPTEVYYFAYDCEADAKRVSKAKGRPLHDLENGEDDPVTAEDERKQ